MKNLTLYSAVFDAFYPFGYMDLFNDFKVAEVPEDMTDPGVLVVWGGGDISPSLYNKEVSTKTQATYRPSKRDSMEWELMKGAVEKGMDIIGICRGAQMLCALAGGHLIQDVTNHAGDDHMITLHTGEQIQVCSVHHQMMYPWDVEHKMIAWSTENLSHHYMDVNTKVNVPCEPEQVYFPTVKGHAIQWHPEFMPINCLANQYIEEYFQNVLV